MTAMTRSTGLVGVCVLLVLAAGTASAQTSTGKIVGVVQDTSGAVLPGVTIVVRNLGTATSRDAVTDDRGQCDVSGLAPGRYQVEAELQGFRKVSQGPAAGRAHLATCADPRLA